MSERAHARAKSSPPPSTTRGLEWRPTASRGYDVVSWPAADHPQQSVRLESAGQRLRPSQVPARPVDVKPSIRPATLAESPDIDRPSRDSVQVTWDGGEQQAERIAEQITHMPAGVPPDEAAHTELAELNSLPLTVRRAVGEPAQPIDAETRGFMEARFGHDLGHVRIHTGSRAAEAARLLSADALAAGSHVLFGAGRFSPTTSDGRRLLAHELTHVLQHSAHIGSSVPPFHRAEARPQNAWLPELNQLLPPVGPVAQIDRVEMLINVLGTDQLERYVPLIHADAEAKKFSQENGVPGIIALYDASREGKIDAAAARRALTTFPERYTRTSLEKLRLRPVREAPPRFFFEDPASQQQETPGEGELPRPGSEERKVVFVESELAKARAGKSQVFVRFAYPSLDLGTNKIKQAKESILTEVANAMASLTGLSPTSSRAERREELTTHAKLGEAWREFGAKSPLNVYIATDPRTEMETGQVAAVTTRVFVRLQDIGDSAKLQAAIRIPLIMLRGGVLPTAGGPRDIPAAGPQELQGILLHEALHVMLINKSIDADAVWNAARASLAIRGSPYLMSKAEELMRKFLIAQEEVFAYTNEASLRPLTDEERKDKASYESFIKNVGMFLDRRKIPIHVKSNRIRVAELIEGKRVDWQIIYQVPSGVIDTTVGDIESIELLLSVFVLR